MANILIVEDNTSTLQMIRDTLEALGHRVLCGANGREGVDLLNQTNPLPDLIISDFAMPEMDGATLLMHVRSHFQWSQIPFVVMSGCAENRSLIDGLGANAFMDKPFRLVTLNELVNRYTLPQTMPAG